ncbi:AAA family ATPase [Natronorubrum sp. JWXQ-INN-674]|uniref:AAA family ATPase n=1 Tax=Natronorubrum halalkaliphilum TaxID=2691917 RepID=A0A6B0VK25_9EURY|nr:ATP-binding protein [Natronorubrum halalkaliphilum]MXV61878.1 AAA family ATPase [Natronorubrum halalkaliphilum]
MSEYFTPKPATVDSDPADVDLDLTFDATPETTLEDIVGLADSKAFARNIIEPLAVDAGITTSNLLVHGPSGNGKTLFVDAICGELAADGFSIGWLQHFQNTPGDATEIVGQAVRDAIAAAPSVLVLDQFNQWHRDDLLNTLRAEFARIEQTDARVLVIATTAFDSFSSSSIPFEAAIEVDEPDTDRACALLETYLEEFAAKSDVGVTVDTTDETLQEAVEGLSALELRTGTKQAFQRVAVGVEQTVQTDTLIESLSVTADSKPRSRFGPQSADATDDRFVEETDVNFDDIGGLEEVKAELQAAIEYPKQFPQTYDECGLAAAGVLLYGPPGNGKTMLAKAVANEYDRTFITVEGPELQDSLVGSTEKNIRKVFESARENAPSVVFFDEIDALAPSRNDVHASYEVDFINTLLAELDGFKDIDDVLVVGATNRPHALDDALLRTGRLERHIRVPVPDSETANAVIESHAGDYPFADDVSADWIAAQFDSDVPAATMTGVCDHALRWYAMRRVADAGGSDDELEIRRDDIRAALEDYPTDVDDSAASSDDSGRGGFY